MSGDSKATAKKDLRITSLRPVLGISSYQEAVAFYVDLLGFTLDWEWRVAPGRPVIMSVSRDGYSMMLNEAPGGPPRSDLHFNVTDLQALTDEINQRTPGSATLIIGPPYDTPTTTLIDPFGNFIHFEQAIAPEEEAEREKRKVLMREHVQSLLSSGKPFPTSEALVDAIGKPLGIAIDVLNEFPEYGA